MGPLLEKLKLAASSSLKKLAPTKIRLKEIKQNISLDSRVLYVVYTRYGKTRSHLNSHCRTIDFFFFLRFTFSLIFSDMPRHHFGHFINNIKREKGKEYRKEGQLIYFISKSSTPNISSAAQWAKTSPGTNPATEITRAVPIYTWPDRDPFHSKPQSKPWKSYQR